MITHKKLCQNKPRNLFSNATTQKQIREGKKICRQCPALQQCHQYVTKLNEYHNRQTAQKCGRSYQKNRDIYIQGVVAAQYWNATDGRGRPLDVKELDRIARQTFG